MFSAAYRRILLLSQPPLIALVMCAGAACSAPTDDATPEERCEDVCGKTAACGWADEQGFVLSECERECVRIYESSVMQTCDDRWTAAMRCSQETYSCEPLDDDPCEEENTRFEECIR